MRRCLPLVGLAAAWLFCAPAWAQYMFIDVNGDGACTTDDVFSAASTSFDVWIDTNRDADGSDAACNSGPEELTINSYTIALTWMGGPATFGTWADAMGFTIDLGSATGGNEAFVGWGLDALTPLPAGRHKLGSYSVTVAAGHPHLYILPIGSLSPDPTSFGTACFGSDFDNTYKYMQDWFDACGIANPTISIQASTWGRIKDRYR